MSDGTRAPRADASPQAGNGVVPATPDEATPEPPAAPRGSAEQTEGAARDEQSGVAPRDERPARAEDERVTVPAAAGSERPALILGSPTADVDAAADSSRLPGQHRGGFSRLPTAPVAVAVPSGPKEDPEPQWSTVPPAGPQRGLAAWALAFAALGLAASLFVGWGFPIGLVAVVSGILAVRRPTESRTLAGWAIVLGTASLIYSAGWLWYAATQTNLLS